MPRTPLARITFITGSAAVALAAGSRAPESAKVLATNIHLREIVIEVEQMAGGLRGRGKSQTGDPSGCVFPALSGCSPCLSRLPRPHIPLRPWSGRVAQRESTSLTSRGSQVQSLSRPPPTCLSPLSEAVAILSIHIRPLSRRSKVGYVRIDDCAGEVWPSVERVNWTTRRYEPRIR